MDVIVDNCRLICAKRCCCRLRSVTRAEFQVGVLQRSFGGKSSPARIPTHLVNPAKVVMLAFVCHLQEKLVTNKIRCS